MIENCQCCSISTEVPVEMDYLINSHAAGAAALQGQQEEWSSKALELWDPIRQDPELLQQRDSLDFFAVP